MATDDLTRALRAGIEGQLAQGALQLSLRASLQLSVLRANVISPQNPALIERLLADIEANFSGQNNPLQFPAGRRPGAPPPAVRSAMAAIRRSLPTARGHGHPNPFADVARRASIQSGPIPFPALPGFPIMQPLPALPTLLESNA